jgi:hypothetical protein
MKLQRSMGSSAGGWHGPALAFLAGCVALFATAGTPRIDFVETYQTNQVTVHFGIEANRTYILQRATSLTLTSNGVSAVWSNITKEITWPVDDHFVIVDEATNLPVRFYRLKVTP